ncbi:MAG: C40 family peptidase [Thermoleophilia bacterium]|nr:C40 family peptidase [Thermoleophilia bacterium]
MQINVEKYNQASTELDEILQRIEKNEALLEETLANLEASQERLEKRVVSIYRNGTVEVLDVLMATNDIKEFMSSFDLLAKIGEQDHSDLEQVKLFKAQVEETQAQLAEDQATQAALVDELESKKSQIEAGIAERERMMTGIEEEIAALEEEQRTRDLAAAQARLAAESVSYSGGGSSGGSSGGYAPAPAFSGGGDVVSIAMQYLGVPYVWGGASPSGFDCSGLTQYVYRQAGISLPRTAAAQQGAGTPIGYGQLAPGDLVFFGSPAYHVGIYIGGGSMIHAPYPGTVVSIAPLMGGFSGGVRV